MDVSGRTGRKNSKSVEKNYETKKESLCPYEKKCGGCSYLHMTYNKQLKKKQKLVESYVGKFCEVKPILGMQDPTHYRNKVHAVFARDRKGQILAGTYEKKSHRVVDVENCLIENATASQIIKDVKKLVKSFKIKIYDEDTDYGLLRHILVRVGHKSGQVMVVLVLRSPVFPSKNNFVKALRELHPEITTVVLNVNDKATSMVLGKRDIVLYGKGYIEDELCGLQFRISPQSFYQVNSVQTEKLYNKALAVAELTGTEKVIDAYCGIGTIGMIAAKKAGSVIGVELNSDAVKDAINNAKKNQIQNISFYNDDATKFMLRMAEQGEKADVVLMDPPRSGSTKEFMEAVTKLAPKRVVYVSCNPETLGRDLEYFVKHGYKAEAAWPCDMFCFAEHVETVVLMSKKNS